MKTVLFIFAALLTFFTTAPASAADQVFKAEMLTHWLLGPGDFVLGRPATSCNEANQERVRRAAEEKAKQDCESAGSMRDCFVKSSRITFNGTLEDDMYRKYSLKDNRGNAFGTYGCEAEAIVYGFRQ